MPRRKKPVPLRKQQGSTAELRQALTRRKKSELVDILMELARGDRGVLWQLTARFDVSPAPDELVAATRPAMSSALELMKRGSYLVEMSDEGLMTEDVEDCLKEILEALGKSDLSLAGVIAWCSAMLEDDRIGFIAREPLQSLRNHFQTTADQ